MRFAVGNRWETGKNCIVFQLHSMSLNTLLRPEAAIALRQRLNETTDQLDALREEHIQLQVEHETQSRDLTIAKSDCTFSTQYLPTCSLTVP